jgi:hypothetical protein
MPVNGGTVRCTGTTAPPRDGTGSASTSKAATTTCRRSSRGCT